MTHTLISLPYELARVPLVLVDNAVAKRLPESSRSRVTLDRAIGSADRLAGALLRNGDIAQRGTDRLRRSADLALRRAESRTTALHTSPSRMPRMQATT